MICFELFVRGAAAAMAVVGCPRAQHDQGASWVTLNLYSIVYYSLADGCMSRRPKATDAS
jgi:hypothetical protein